MKSSGFKMGLVVIALFTVFASTFQTRSAVQAQVAALGHQIAVLQCGAPRRLRLKQSDRFLWILVVLDVAGVAALTSHPEARHGRPLASARIGSLFNLDVALQTSTTGDGCLHSHLIRRKSRAQHAGER
jgi:hypothetical protein